MSNPVFENELIEEHEKAYEKVKNTIYLLAGANGNDIAMVSGYHEDNEEYEFAKYAEFGTFEDADYAHIAIKHYHHALQEIQRLREELRVITEAGLKDRSIVNMFVTKWNEDKPNE